MKDWHEFVDFLSEEELGILMELVYQVYEDGNLYEWFCNIVDVDPDHYRKVFEEVVAFSSEEGTEGQDHESYTDTQDHESYVPGSGEYNDAMFGSGEEQDGFIQEDL